MKEKTVDPLKPEFIDVEQLRKAVAGIKDEFSEVEFTGGGEPLLHKRIGEIIQLFDSKYTKLYTNGFMLKDIPKISEVNISRVHWDSAINNVFYQSNQQNELEVALDHYASIAGRIRMQTILMKGAIDTQDKLEEFIARFEDRVDVFMVRTLFSKCGLDKDKFVDYFNYQHPKLVYDTTLDDYSRDLFFIGSDAVLHNDFQYE
jgi:molybdenum cofactor biosynthesis enzyme MoaA